MFEFNGSDNGGIDLASSVDEGKLESTVNYILGICKTKRSKIKVTNRRGDAIGFAVSVNGYPMCNIAIFIERYPDASYIELSSNPELVNLVLTGTLLASMDMVENALYTFIQAEDMILKKINDASMRGEQINPSNPAMKPVVISGISITPVLKKNGNTYGIQFMYEATPLLTIKMKDDLSF